MKFIRPEDIKIYNEDGPERVKGKIRKLIFKGDIVYLEFNYGEIENPM